MLNAALKTKPVEAGQLFSALEQSLALAISITAQGYAQAAVSAASQPRRGRRFEPTLRCNVSHPIRTPWHGEPLSESTTGS